MSKLLLHIFIVTIANLLPLVPLHALSETYTPMANPKNDEEIIRKCLGYLRQLGSHKSNFRQESINPMIGEVEISKGKLYISAPLLLRWEYTEPKKQLVICDGKRIWMYIPKDRQVFTEPVQDSHFPDLITALSQGYEQVTGKFDIKESRYDNNQTLFRIILEPKTRYPNLSALQLNFNIPHIRLEGFVIEDAMEAKTTIYIDNMETYDMKNAKQDMFKFKPPDNATIYDFNGERINPKEIR